MFPRFFRYRRTTHVTPKSYLSFLTGYKTIYQNQRSEIGDLAERMNTGLEKLVEASQSVAELALELADKEKELALASAKAEEVLKEVSQSPLLMLNNHFNRLLLYVSRIQVKSLRKILFQSKQVASECYPRRPIFIRT